jgi:hypothetical protein
MLLCDLILSNTLRKAMPRLKPDQELVYYKDGRCRVVEKKQGILPRSSFISRQKRRW